MPAAYDASDIASMTVRDHLNEAARLMEGPAPDTDNYDVARADNVATAQAHLLFASVLVQAADGGAGLALKDFDLRYGGR